MAPNIPRPRPTFANRQMALDTASRVANDLIVGGLIRADVKLQATNHIAAAALKLKKPDGYSIAKVLDSEYGWNCTLDIAEILDSFGSYLDDEIREAQREWVLRTNIRPQFGAGDAIVLSTGETGIVTGIDDRAPASYLVKIDGDPEGDLPTERRRIVYFEHAAPASAGG